jgi:hypothetical protein
MAFEEWREEDADERKKVRRKKEGNSHAVDHRSAPLSPPGAAPADNLLSGDGIAAHSFLPSLLERGRDILWLGECHGVVREGT